MDTQERAHERDCQTDLRPKPQFKSSPCARLNTIKSLLLDTPFEQPARAVLNLYRLVKTANEPIRWCLGVARGIAMWSSGSTDYRRWTGHENLLIWWEPRTREMASLISAGMRVLEFGAGTRVLEKYLPEGCTYIASDLVDRGAGTIICDLNERPLPNLSGVGADVAVFAGVLEYVHDIASLARWLRETGIQQCVLSYDPLPSTGGPRRQLYARLRRCRWGYLNHHTESLLLTLFDTAGFVYVQRKAWSTQVIYRLVRRQ